MSPKNQPHPQESVAMNTETTPAGTATIAAQTAGVGNVDQIRDILFGTQMRDYERRFVRLEERISKEVVQLREDTRKHFDTLETFVRGEFEALSERISSEHRDRSSRDEQLGAEVDKLLKMLQTRAAELDEKVTRIAHELRQQLLTQSKSLSEEIQARFTELSTLLERECDQLRGAKVDRSKLSEMLTQLALQLTNEQAFSLNLGTGKSDNE